MTPKLVGLATEVLAMAIIISVMLLFMGIGILITIHACIIRRAFRISFSGDINIVERGSTSMSQEDIDKLPCFDYITKEKGTSPAADCAVCLDNFKSGEKCRLLPLCNHSFHAECVDSWLLKKPMCPVCRTIAGPCKTGSVSGEESSRFTDSQVDMRGNSLTTDSSRMSDAGLNGIDGELGQDQIMESGDIGDLGIDQTEDQNKGSTSNLYLNDLQSESSA
ncbi:Zinc finger, RING-type [Dillenia turbinata]|uniref:Zinc finger, RING-type n=1 Tax=Dillenia turbinata TaxID=194707 RepID=A0AAN8UD30_9MAGN